MARVAPHNIKSFTSAIPYCLRYLFSLLFFVAMPEVSATVIYRNNFEDDLVGTYTNANLDADWNDPSGNDGIDEGRVTITDDADAYGTKSLVVTYPEGLSNTGKSQWGMTFDQPYEELYLSYRIRFDDNFDFVRGGKLPGLCGGACNSGGTAPSGTDGWSARMMWRTDGSGGSPTNRDTANIVQYTYHVDQPTEFGDDMRWDDGSGADWKEFESDQWYHLQHRVVMNTPGVQDGVIQAWLDGELVLDRQDIRFRDISSVTIDHLYFSTFFGGSSEPWETTKDERAYYDDFIVSTVFILSGDYNSDGVVDAADYTVWRDALGETGGNLPADGTGDGVVDQLDYDLWLANYGATTPAAATSSAVPEPTTVVTILIACLGSLIRRQKYFPRY